MKATISLDGILAFLRSLSLSASNKEWLGQKLIEDAHREKAAAKGESYEDFINRMCGAWDDDPRTAEEITAREAAESDKDSRLSQLFGIWSDGPTAEEVIDEIRSSRTSASRKEEDAALLDKINGAWADDGVSAEEEIRSLRAERRQNLTRNIEEL